MHRYLKLALSLALPVGVLAGCSDWLTTPKAIQNPNVPTKAGRDALLVGVETGQTVLQTGDLARTFSMWTQQMAGTDRQYVGIGLYIYDEDFSSGDWSEAYTGGGLIDERSMRQQALAAGDSIYAGVAMVWEALTMGTVADVWGDVPYSQAVSNVLEPKLDPQEQVFAEVQATLDTALRYLHCTASTCSGPQSGADLIYGGDIPSWIAVAHTLKARYYMHTAAVHGAADYAAALVQADSGIPDAAHDFRTYQSSNNFPNEANLWFQFIVQQRQGYIGAGAFLVNLLDSTGDPRLAQYFAKNGEGQYLGAPPGGGSGDYSTLSATRLDPAFRQPVVTYAENQLIKAEAALRGGDMATALTAFNAERASQGVPPVAGPLTLQQIITEKYIADFQEIEVWNDYKRTCLPNITPATPPLAAPGGVPGRLLYPLTAERNSNPNIPAPQNQPPRNWDQPTACPGEN